MAYKTVVVGTDGSATADAAVDAAIALSIADGSRLVIVTAYEAAAATSNDGAPEDVRWMLTDRNEAEQRARVARTRAAAAGLGDVVVQSLEGSPAEQLIDTATTFNADLLVVGSVGLAHSAHFLLGSVAGSVLHHAPCDVLVVRTD